MRILLLAALHGDYAALALQAKHAGALVSQADTLPLALETLRRTPSAPARATSSACPRTSKP
jgi:hypothetical protein